MASPETCFAETVDGTLLAYQTLGEGPVDIVWSFAFLSDVELIWEFPPLAEFLHSLASFSRLVVHDRRGMGRSGGQLSFSLQRDSDDLLTLLDEIGIERPCLGGPVTGGAHSAAFAAMYPGRVSSVVWYGAFARSAKADDYPWGSTEEEHLALERGILDEWATEARARSFFVEPLAERLADDPETTRFFARWMERSTSASDAAALQRFWYQVDLRPQLSTVSAPTLILHRGELEHEEELHTASLLPNAEVVALPGTDYMPFVGDIEPIVREIRGFALRNAAR